MKIAVFNYKISNCGTKDSGGGECLNSRIIEMQINEFIEDKQVIDIKQSTYTTKRHNNAGFDEVWIEYTILYK